MLKIIAHRGHWWPRRDLQNHPASILNALSAGYGAEVDVWGVLADGLRVGHDDPTYGFTPPAGGPLRDYALGPLVLHLKAKANLRGIFEVLQARGWLPHSYAFFSPSDDAGLDQILYETPSIVDGPKRLVTVDNPQSLDILLSLSNPLGGADGVWLEQPEDDWVEVADILEIQETGKSAWVVSSELHGRKLDLGKVVGEWAKANAIVTDYPHLLARVLDDGDPVVHPKEAWWLA